MANEEFNKHMNSINAAEANSYAQSLADAEKEPKSEYLAKLHQGVEVPFSIGPFTLPPEFIQHIETGQTNLSEADMLFRFFQKVKMHIAAEKVKVSREAFNEGLEKGHQIGFEKGKKVRARFLLWAGAIAGYLFGALVSFH
jgi:flagellar biosynthesis/type III secretory pathway protein FliH